VAGAGGAVVAGPGEVRRRDGGPALVVVDADGVPVGVDRFSHAGTGSAEQGEDLLSELAVLGDEPRHQVRK